MKQATANKRDTNEIDASCSMSHASSSRGFAMLFSVLVSSVLLSIGLSIFNLTVKELVLSSSGRESQFAFYAADTGVECAMYWDFKGLSVFATSTDNRVSDPAAPDCVTPFGQAAQVVTHTNYVAYPPAYAQPRDADHAVTQFSLTIPNPSGNYCVTVTVVKDASSGVLRTIIDSRGYNTCDTTDPSRIERAMRVTY